MSWISITLIVILVFGVMFTLLYTSVQLRPLAHATIPTEPRIAQLQVLEIAEEHLNEHLSGLKDVRLFITHYNFSADVYRKNPKNYVIGYTWPLSGIREHPELLQLPLVYFHPNGTAYRISDGVIDEVYCVENDDCPKGRDGRCYQVREDRLIYRLDIVADTTNNDGTIAAMDIDAETGKVIFSAVRDNKPRPELPRFVLEPVYTLKELNTIMEGEDAIEVDIIENASEIPAKDNEIYLSDYDKQGYDPAHVRTILFNATKIAWLNQDSMAHTVTSDESYRNILGYKFDSDILEPGETFVFVFTDVGDYSYHCDIHPYMRGKVEIVENFA